MSSAKGATSTCLILTPACLHRRDLGLEHFLLDRDDDRLGLAAPAVRVGHHLVIPRHFVDRERHVLLRLERDDLLDLRGIDGRQLDEAHEDALAGDGEIAPRGP